MFECLLLGCSIEKWCKNKNFEFWFEPRLPKLLYKYFFDNSNSHCETALTKLSPSKDLTESKFRRKFQGNIFDRAEVMTLEIL